MRTVKRSGATIAYEVGGDGEPMLLIMGLAADSRMWMMQLPAFTEHHRTITVDNRGVGGSSPLAGPVSVEDMAADALGVLDEERIERAHVVGISLGGAIAQRLALKAPERVSSLVLAATWAGPNAYLERIAATGRSLAETAGLDALVRASMLWLFTPRVIIDQPYLVDTVENLARETHPPIETFLAQTDAVLAHDARSELASLSIPTLVMVGKRDILVPPELSEELASLIPGAELALFESSHAFNFEEAAAFNARIIEFVAQHRG